MISHWYRIWDRDEDNPPPEVRQIMDADKLGNILQLNKLSLQKFAGIDDDLWIWVLEQCKLVKVNAADKVICAGADKWKAFFEEHTIDAEVVSAAPLKSSTRWYIRLGRKTDKWEKCYPSVLKQANDGKLYPPRCPGMEVIGRRVNAELRVWYEEQNYPEEDDWVCDDTCEKDNNDNVGDNFNSNKCADSEAANPHATERPSVGNTKFPLLEKYGLADLDLSDNASNDYFKRILGEMVAKQQQHTEEKNVIDYFQLQQNTTTTAVTIRSHKSEEAFMSFHRKNPYLKDVVRCLHKEDAKVGATRLADFLAKHHENEFIDAANAAGVAVCGVLDETESAALYTEANLIDEQWNTIMRHLRHKFGAKIACSLLEAKRKCHEGFTMPRVKVIYHRAGDKDEEKIVAEYQDIRAEFKKTVAMLLRYYKVKKRKHVRVACSWWNRIG